MRREEPSVSEIVHLEMKAGVALVTVDRPEALNAINRDLLAAFDRVIDAIDSNAEARALVVTGAGRAFIAGADIAEMKTMTPLEAEAFSASAHRIFSRLEGLRIPTIAATG